MSDEFVDIPADRRRGSAVRAKDTLNKFIQDPSSARGLDLGESPANNRPNPGELLFGDIVYHTSLKPGYIFNIFIIFA
jgi:hypothetical protein